MADTSARHTTGVADELLRRVAAALRGAQLYSPGHPLVTRNIVAFSELILRMLDGGHPVSIALVADEVIIGERPVPKGASVLGELFARLKSRGIERLTVEPGATTEELTRVVLTLSERLRANSEVDDSSVIDTAHVHVGLVRLGQRTEASLADMATLRRLYSEASVTTRQVWETAIREGKAQAEEIRTVVNDLATAITQNRNSMLALTSMRAYDDYTFTHMVNVSILVMAQARALGIEGSLLREFGVAGLMHDIGKTQVPPEIIKKAGRLDARELSLMRRHPITGAEMLKRQKDITPLAAVVAFEHHLRLDGSGYPEGVSRAGLNVATMMCTIADVYDAMRSKRGYQQAHPVDRILGVLNQVEKREFEPHLVQRFIHLMGLYPIGSLVRLNTGVLAVVLRPFAPDPYRARVRAVFAADGHKLDLPYDIDLWDVEPAPHRSSSIAGPATPPDPTFDPLSVVQ